MPHSFFVTGTDTEVGKTYVTSMLLRAAANCGLKTLAMKPVAAGCEDTAEGLRNEDALQLQSAMTESLPYELVNPVVLREPVSPHIAAKHEGIEVSIRELVSRCQKLMAQPVDLFLVEGAGGWRVPLNETENISDLARELNMPVILVVDLKLGCLNHALLSAEAIERDGLKLAGWVANQSRPEAMRVQEENLQTLKDKLRAPWLGLVGYQEAVPRLDLGALLGVKE